jgi:hypothetical protein
LGKIIQKKHYEIAHKITESLPNCYMWAIDIHIFIWYYPANDYEAY